MANVLRLLFAVASGRFTCRQFQVLPASSPELESSLSSPQAWDALRTDQTDTVFSIPQSRDIWVQKAKQNVEVKPRCREWKPSELARGPSFDQRMNSLVPKRWAIHE
jgi:hypothetical protein